MPSQGALLSFLLDHSLKKLNEIWYGVQSNLPANIFNFTIKYLKNTLPTRKSLSLWKLCHSSGCQFCLLPETLLHAVAACKAYLQQGRYIWRYDSVLNFLATSLKIVEGSSLFANIPGFPSPSIISGDDLRHDLLLITKDNCLYILELMIGFETNISNDTERKHLRYSRLVSDVRSQYTSVTLENISMSSLGIYANSCLSFLKCVTPSLSLTSKNAFSFLNYLQFQFEQHTTSSAAETNHGATRIYFAFNIFVFIFLPYIRRLLFTFLHVL